MRSTRHTVVITHSLNIFRGLMSGRVSRRLLRACASQARSCCTVNERRFCAGLHPRAQKLDVLPRDQCIWRPRTLAVVASHATPQSPAALRKVAAGCSLRLLLRTRGPGVALRAALAALATDKSPGVRCRELCLAS